MKPIKIKIKGKRYIVKPVTLVLAVVLAIALVALIAAIIAFSFENKKTQPTPTISAEATYVPDAYVIDQAEYDGTVLAESEDAGQEYIDSTLFLGDSNTARFLKVTDSEGNTFTSLENTIGVVGMGIDSITTLPCMQFSTGLFTMPKAVAILQPERVIITFGTNNLSGSSTDATSFIERYTKQIQAIVDAYPSVDIIVNSIPPVAKSRSYTNVTMTQIDAYNKAIVDMCEENDWKYLNSAEALKDSSTGYAKDGYTIQDGLHLSSKGLEALFEYIRTHAWITEDDRPKPLSTIPTVIGVPDGLIQTNPLTEEEFTEDPSVETYEATYVTVEETAEATATATATPEETASATTTTVACPADKPSGTYPDCYAPIAQPEGVDCLGGTWNDRSGACVCLSGYTNDTTGGCVATPVPATSETTETTTQTPATEEATTTSETVTPEATAASTTATEATETATTEG